MDKKKKKKKKKMDWKGLTKFVNLTAAVSVAFMHRQSYISAQRRKKCQYL
jgi:hypothetical protein